MRDCQAAVGRRLTAQTWYVIMTKLMLGEPYTISWLNDEQREWARLTPEQRYMESCQLWSTYLAFGGSLDPEPDSQSHFDFPELQRAVPGDGRPPGGQAGVYFIRRR